MAERVAGLPELERYLLTSLAYLHLHYPEAEHFAVGQLVGEFDKMTSSLRDKVVELVFCYDACSHFSFSSARAKDPRGGGRVPFVRQSLSVAVQPPEWAAQRAGGGHQQRHFSDYRLPVSQFARPAGGFVEPSGGGGTEGGAEAQWRGTRSAHHPAQRDGPTTRQESSERESVPGGGGTEREGVHHELDY